MDTHAQSPHFMSGIRKHGRYPFESFKPLNTIRHASIGSKSIGKINIDCQLLFKKSRWGVLGRDEIPAGIIYINLNFGPPQGCRVKNATVTITLDEEATCLERYRSGRVFHESGCPVQMTELYGPKELAGQNKTAYIKQATKLVPTVNVLGNGAGGIGLESKKAFTHSARWSFNGQLLPGPGKKNRAIYKSLRWELNENELESQSFHSSKVSTAFTFEHSGQPFLLDVDIDGKLEKWNDRIKSKLKFGSTLERGGKVVSLIDFEDYSRFKQVLDPIAESLPWAMEMQNFQEIPIVVPDSISGTTFQPINASLHSDYLLQNQALNSSTPLQTLRTPSRPSLLMAKDPRLTQQAATLANIETAPRVESLLQALEELENPDTYKVLTEDFSTPSSSTTIVNPNGDGLDTETLRMIDRQLLQSDQRIIKRRGDEEVLARVIDLPFIITLLRLLANFMKLLGKDGKGPQLKEGSEDMIRSLPDYE